MLLHIVIFFHRSIITNYGRTQAFHRVLKQQIFFLTKLRLKNRFKDMKNFDRYSWMTFIGFWGMAFIASVITCLIEEDIPVAQSLIGSVALITILCLIAYIHIRYLTPLLQQRKWFQYAFAIIVITVLNLCLEYWIVEWMYEKDLGNNPLWQFVLVVFTINLFLIAASVLLYEFNKGWMKAIEDKANLKNEKLLTELQLLKAQINPHFLFNTLNNIYYYASTQHPDTPEMIEKLSNILRYIVYECQGNRALLKKEMESLENLFNLYQIKNDEQTAITFEKNNCNSNLQIAPLLLLNLLENAFKHSDALSNEKGFIKVKANVDDSDILHFQISNSVKKSSRKKAQHGMGQNNISKQLTLAYPNKQELNTTLEGHIFNLNLAIQLDRKDG